jgi:hypothetical protein
MSDSPLPDPVPVLGGRLDLSASAKRTGLLPTAEPQSVSVLSDCDPSRWELSEETRAHIREIERAIIRPGDPRLNDPTLIGPAGPAIGLDGYGSQARPLAQGTEARSAETSGLGPKGNGPVSEADAPSDLLSRLSTTEASLKSALARAERMEKALVEAEACMSIVAPRSNMAEYLRILWVVRSALAAEKD